MSDGIAFKKLDDETPLPERCILAFTRFELKIFRSLLPEGKDIRPLFGGLTRLAVWPDLVLAGPVLGAPHAGMVLEILARRGVRQILSLGLCGALRHGLEWGAIILPDSSYSEEGTSAHYPLPAGEDRPDKALFKRLEDALQASGYPCASGPVWTTDAPFRETRDKVQACTKRGILGVDMETSAVMTVARFRGVAWAGLLVVSDLLWSPDWRPGFHAGEFKKGLQKAAEIILAVNT